jgi:hypothetical protein
MTTYDSGSSPDSGMTVREIGGQVWAALGALPEEDIRWDVRNKVVDIVMSVLARYDGQAIRNDPDMPVSPLMRD